MSSNPIPKEFQDPTQIPQSLPRQCMNPLLLWTSVHRGVWVTGSAPPRMTLRLENGHTHSGSAQLPSSKSHSGLSLGVHRGLVSFLINLKLGFSVTDYNLNVPKSRMSKPGTVWALVYKHQENEHTWRKGSEKLKLWLGRWLCG